MSIAEEKELMDRLRVIEDYNKRILTTKNKILAVRIERLRLLKQHYQDYKLDLDLKSHDSKLDSLVSRTKYTVYETSKKRIEELQRRVNEENIQLEGQISDAEDRLDRYKRLDPNLLAEYRRLKDDLECQYLLMEISEKNKGERGI